MRTVTLLTILLSLSFTQDYSLQFDGEDDYAVDLPPKVVPIVKLVFVENEGETEYDTQTVHT